MKLRKSNMNKPNIFCIYLFISYIYKLDIENKFCLKNYLLFWSERLINSMWIDLKMGTEFSHICNRCKENLL